MDYRNSDDLVRNLRNLNRDPWIAVRPWWLDGQDPGVRVEFATFAVEHVFPFTDEDLEGWIDSMHERLDVELASLHSEYDKELSALIEAVGAL